MRAPGPGRPRTRRGARSPRAAGPSDWPRRTRPARARAAVRCHRRTRRGRRAAQLPSPGTSGRRERGSRIPGPPPRCDRRWDQEACPDGPSGARPPSGAARRGRARAASPRWWSSPRARASGGAPESARLRPTRPSRPAANPPRCGSLREECRADRAWPSYDSPLGSP